MGKNKKRVNRVISFACLGLFACSISVASLVSARVISEYKENRKLVETKEKMLDEQEYQKTLNDNLKNDEYYSAYFYGNYALYDQSDIIIIIEK